MKPQVAIGVAVAVVFAVLLATGLWRQPVPQSQAPLPDATKPTQDSGQRVSVVGYWECLPHKNSGPGTVHTMECAFGIARDQSDGHYAINTSLMSTYPVDRPTGTKVRVSGVVHPADPNSPYDIDGVLWATAIERL